MIPTRFIPLVFKYMVRRRARSILTIGGVATAMFLFYSVQAMQQGVREATQPSSEDTKLIVYRQDRYCPFTSNLPQDYHLRIAAIPGVKAAVPVKVMVSNCRTGLDVVTFRGVPDDGLESGFFGQVRLQDGSLDGWKRRSDAAIVGERLAKRRNLKVGDQMELGGLTITVAGILESTEPQDRNVAYTHLDFVQRAAGNRPGVVTQFNVAVVDPSQLREVARLIDEEFRTAQEPTATWSEKSFVGRVAADIIEIVKFAGWLGWGCIAGVFALVANAIFLSVQDRIRDHAVMQTLGYGEWLIARLIVAEAMTVSFTGGIIGVAAGMLVTRIGMFSFSVEGLSIHIHAGIGSIALGLFLSALTGVLAGLIPAFQASRREVAACFRAV
ncbi:MAG: ABC transporter permease [Desulfomonile sp.]|nr:ABC transporter permease [Desulfomonile sp.]